MTRPPAQERWIKCPACGNLVLMDTGDVHALETLRSECQGPRHAPSIDRLQDRLM